MPFVEIGQRIAGILTQSLIVKVRMGVMAGRKQKKEEHSMKNDG